ncbi:MAG: hypothetical protein SCH71_10705 [Desulfobulbaceae bacterium]|nr:hypothetical protein [Desulfobulbaceae bacterium]
MKEDERESILEEEVIILRNSGEIPEIALHSSLYYLEEDENGPHLSLLEKELNILYEAALYRAQQIILRDLNPDNRDLSIYRGPARAIVNWQRLQNFCRRIDRQCPGFNEVVSRALVSFLRNEVRDVETSARQSSVNCSRSQLYSFVQKLCLEVNSLPRGWESLCRK